jgi:glyoxylase-like metal-dependent hydrolase (beta-lactamase superfamily II)/rhodanese-related sulfurtransferase
MNSPLILKQFRHEGCLSYLLFDAATRKCIVIDPTIEAIDEFTDHIRQHGLTPVIAIDTHTHADHYSATHFFRNEYQAEIAMSQNTLSARATKRLKHGDILKAGAIELNVLETFGHTPDSISLYGHGLLFTGDTLFIGSSGRTDFKGADPEQQWQSIHIVIGELAPQTVILPGHDYNNFIFSTLEVEKEKNRHWIPHSKEKFIALKNSEVISGSDAEILKRIKFNKIASPLDLPSIIGTATACGVPTQGQNNFNNTDVKTYHEKLITSKGSGIFIDVREPDEFKAGHIPGTKNIPLSMLALEINSIPKNSEVYLSCLSGGRSSKAANTLSYLGYNNITNIVGGFKAWEASGYIVGKN